MFIISVHEKCIFEYSLPAFYAFRGGKTMQDLHIAIRLFFCFSWGA